MKMGTLGVGNWPINGGFHRKSSSYMGYFTQFFFQSRMAAWTCNTTHNPSTMSTVDPENCSSRVWVFQIMTICRAYNKPQDLRMFSTVPNLWWKHHETSWKLYIELTFLERIDHDLSSGFPKMLICIIFRGLDVGGISDHLGFPVTRWPEVCSDPNVPWIRTWSDWGGRDGFFQGTVIAGPWWSLLVHPNYPLAI